jgi:hypothetical protein
MRADRSHGARATAEIVVEAYVDLLGAVTPEGLSKLLADAERDCFVGASLSAKPTYRWIVDGEEIG